MGVVTSRAIATASDLFGLKQSAKQYPATASSNVSNIVIFPFR